MKNILILGGNSDIAKAVARLYASKKCRIILAGRSISSMENFAQDLRLRFEIEVLVYSFDATHFSTHSDFYRNLSIAPDIVICAFGYLGDQALAQTNWDMFNQILNSNYNGAVSILSVVSNDMEARKAGVIVGISSVAGDRGRQSNYYYGSAKAGFTTFLSGLRNRLYPAGVHVITVKPGFVATKMTEGLNLPSILTATDEQVAKGIVRSIEKRKDIVYILPIWQLIMIIIKLIPEFVFKKLRL